MEERDDAKIKFNLGKQQRQKVTLNTKGCCFFCLNAILPENISVCNENHNNLSSFSIRNLCRHLRIPVSQIVNSLTPPVANFKRRETKSDNSKTDTIVDLCVDYFKITERFTASFYQLEKVSMEIHNCMETLHFRISDQQKNAELMENYSKLMTSDLETLKQLACVDKLRKEMINKFSTERLVPLPIIKIRKLSQNLSIIKSEEIDMLQQSTIKVETLICNSPDNEMQNSDYFLSEDSDSNFIHMEVEESIPEHEKMKMECFKTAENLSKSTSKIPREIPKGKAYSFNNSTKMYCCLHCSSEYKFPRDANLHYKSKHISKICVFCHQSGFLSFGDLTEHFQSCADAKLHKNIIPPLQLSKIKSKLTARGSTPANQTFDQEVGVVVCLLCGKQFETRRGCNFHFSKNHSSSSKYNCKFCSRSQFQSYSAFKLHQKGCSASQQRQKKKEDGKYICSECDKRFLRQDGLKLHFNAVHLNQENYKCDVYGEQFKHYSTLRRHKDRFHSDGVFQCEFCNKICSGRRNLGEHKKECKERKTENKKVCRMKEGETSPSEMKVKIEDNL